jgi:hypothetical protein
LPGTYAGSTMPDIAILIVFLYAGRSRYTAGMIGMCRITQTPGRDRPDQEAKRHG